MENRKYTVCRDNVYVGEVIKTNDIYVYEEDGKDVLISGAYYSLRSILFTVNENGCAEDLIYNSPNYPILNITDNHKCLSLGENSLVIRDAQNLADLLTYFGYKHDLTFEDIMKIRKRFFSGFFGINNCELFGMKELASENTESFVYVSTNRSILDRKYFTVLDTRGDDYIGFIFGDVNKGNAFKPHNIEGPVRKLKRF